MENYSLDEKIKEHSSIQHFLIKKYSHVHIYTLNKYGRKGRDMLW